jgi:hypothetical protein
LVQGLTIQVGHEVGDDLAQHRSWQLTLASAYR